MTPVDIDVRDESGVVVASVAGDVDLGDTAEVNGRVLGAVTNEAVGLVVEMTGVRYIDSAGIQMLFQFARALEAGRQTMALVVGTESPLRGLLDITGLPQAVPVCADVPSAVAAVRSGGDRRY